jgi:hypothetical protein
MCVKVGLKNHSQSDSMQCGALVSSDAFMDEVGEGDICNTHVCSGTDISLVVAFFGALGVLVSRRDRGGPAARVMSLFFFSMAACVLLSCASLQRVWKYADCAYLPCSLFF